MVTAITQLPKAQIQQINTAIDHYNTLVHFIRRSLREGLDYGKVQGCGEKPILFKPGAEKIATLFGLRESVERLTAIQDFTGKDYGEPFFFYEYKCILTNRAGTVVAECVGSCNSWEEKYRYRTAQRICPQCGAAAIKRSNYPDKQTGDKGWYCHSKSGGCNAKFHSADERITAQDQGAKSRQLRHLNRINFGSQLAPTSAPESRQLRQVMSSPCGSAHTLGSIERQGAEDSHGSKWSRSPIADGEISRNYPPARVGV